MELSEMAVRQMCFRLSISPLFGVTRKNSRYEMHFRPLVIRRIISYGSGRFAFQCG